MQTLVKNWPITVAVLASALGAAAVNLHIVTSEQLAGAAALIVPFWSLLVHRVTPPTSAVKS